MKKFLNILIFIIIVSALLFNSSEVVESIKLSFSICINNLFPTLIPLLLISNIFINYNLMNDLNDIFGTFFNKIFGINKNTTFSIIMSMISGTPSNAKYLKDTYDLNLIDESDINDCLKFCHFTNPIFILNTIGLTFLNSKKLGLIILISHFLSSFIIGIFRKKRKVFKENFNTNKKDKKNFISILSNSIISSFNTLLIILGVITTCLMLTCILNKVLLINQDYKFIYGLLEITQGLKYLSISNLSINIKAIISSFLISFGGICIHIQVFSILDNKKIRYIPYFLSRIIQGMFSSILTFILINIL